MEAILLTFRYRFLFNFYVNVHARFWFGLRLLLCAERGERSEPSEAARCRWSHVQAAEDKQGQAFAYKYKHALPQTATFINVFFDCVACVALSLGW